MLLLLLNALEDALASLFINSASVAWLLRRGSLKGIQSFQFEMKYFKYMNNTVHEQSST